MYNYTWGGIIDDVGTYRDGYFPTRAERSRGAADSPQIIAATAIYELPFGKNHLGGNNMIGRAIGSGWQLSGIYTYSSGLPLAIVGSGCNDPGGGQCMPNYNPSFSGSARINGHYGHGLLAGQASPSYVNINAFVNAIPAYTFGNVARTEPFGLRGPNSYDVDMSLKRTITIHDNWKFVFDASAYNVSNAVNFSSPAVSTGTASTFGTITGQANSSRDIQLSGRINF
jgi:hypothetical protein